MASNDLLRPVFMRVCGVFVGFEKKFINTSNYALRNKKDCAIIKSEKVIIVIISLNLGRAINFW